MKRADSLKALRVALVSLVVFAFCQASALENPMYQCLDGIEQAERFEIHSNQASFMMDRIKTTNFEGKTISWGDIEDELVKSGYIESASLVNPSSEDKQKMDAKKAKALKDPRIAKLAKKYETEYRSKEAFEKSVREKQDLLSKTYSFHRSRGDAHLITGIEGLDQRDDRLSPVRPYGLLATRAKDDGQYVYTLTKEGMRRLKVSDSAVNNERIFLAYKRHSDGDSEKDRFPKVEVVKIKDSNVSSDWPSDSENKAAGVDSFALSDNPAKTANQFGKKLIVMDFTKLPLTEEVSSDAKAVFKEELSKVIEKVVSSHENQMQYLTRLTAAQKERLQKDWSFDEKKLSEVYTERYSKALQACADLNIGLANKAQDAIVQINANQEGHFGTKQPNRAKIKKEPKSGSAP